MATGFHAFCPLLPDEIELLPELIAARLALTIAVSSWRAVRHPDNAAYILRNQATAWAGLQRLHTLSRENRHRLAAQSHRGGLMTMINAFDPQAATASRRATAT